MTAPTLNDLELDAARLVAVIETQNALIEAGLDVDGAMGLVAERAAGLTGADAGVVEIAEGEEMVYRAASGTAEPHVGIRLRIDSSLSGRAVTERAVLWCDDAEADPRVDHAAARAVGAQSMVCVPLRHRDDVVGVLKVYADRVAAFDETDVRLLGFLSGLIGSFLVHAAEFERTAFESRHDALTGLGNRRAYEERLHREVARAHRYGRPLALVTIDLDGFKAVNDRCGHPAGDDALRGAAHALRRLRAADECFRIGGDEFAILLPDTHPAGARSVAERLAAAIDRAGLGEGGVTATYGIGHFLGQTAEELHADADADLTTAKQRGRRRRAA